MDVKVATFDYVLTDSRDGTHLLPPPPPVGLHWDFPPPPRESVDAGGQVGGRTQPNFLVLVGLPKILTHGAPLARFARWSSAIIQDCY